MMEFSHIGLITKQKKGEEKLVDHTKVWVTNFSKHPFKVEWLRFSSDSPITGPVKEKPHIAFKVDDIEEASKGLKVLIKPFKKPDGGIVGFFEYEDGSIIEFMQYPK